MNELFKQSFRDVRVGREHDAECASHSLSYAAKSDGRDTHARFETSWNYPVAGR